MAKKRIAIVGGYISEECTLGLKALGYDVLILPSDDRLGRAVSSHTDLLVFPFADKLFVYSGEVYSVLAGKALTAVAVKESPSADYPYDIYLNALTVGKYIFARKKYLSEDIAAEAERLGYTVIDVRQGYARCTACPISDRAIITADKAIENAALSVGIDVLTVAEGGVELKGYPYGFIGGACGVDDDTVVFAGDIYTHPSGTRIVDFCEKHGKRVVSLSGEPLRDVGSIFFV